MSNIIPFHFDNHEVRIQIDESGNPWWIAKDVCEVLGLEQVHRALARLKPGEKGGTRITTPGGPQTMATINEPGMYRLIFRSDKPEAARFQSWVFEEVLPSIRKTGKYEASSPLDNYPELRAIADLALGVAQARDLAHAAQLDAAEARAESRQANANAQRALETQLFFTVAEYVAFNKLTAKIRADEYRSVSDFLYAYCHPRGIPIRNIAVAGKSWKTEYGYHHSAYADALPGWLKQRFAQQPLTPVRNIKEEREN